jgi:hypothetical protein
MVKLSDNHIKRFVSVVYGLECGYNVAKVTGAALSIKERTSSLHRVMERVNLCVCVEDETALPRDSV